MLVSEVLNTLKVLKIDQNILKCYYDFSYLVHCSIISTFLWGSKIAKLNIYDNKRGSWNSRRNS